MIDLLTPKQPGLGAGKEPALGHLNSGIVVQASPFAQGYGGQVLPAMCEGVQPGGPHHDRQGYVGCTHTSTSSITISREACGSPRVSVMLNWFSP